METRKRPPMGDRLEIIRAGLLAQVERLLAPAEQQKLLR
jgi:hypothetical protein